MTTRHADLILRAGAVVTEDAACPRASGVAISGGEIVAVGEDEELRALAGRKTEVVDLGGRSVLPGFQDAHVHASGGGLERLQCDLTPVHGVEAYVEVIAKYAAEHPEKEWITGGGWSMDAFPGGIAQSADLDRAAPGRAVFLSNRDHHGAWVSSAALERAGVDARTPDPGDGRIERDPSGRPVGTLQEGAMALVQRHLPPPSTADLAAGILEGQRYLHSLGITAWQEAIVGDYPVTPDCFEAYVSLDEAGKLTGRVVGALWWSRDGGEAQIDTVLARRARAGTDGRFTASAVKFMADGVFENFTAAMLTPYLDGAGRPTERLGTSFFGASELASAVTLVDAHGFSAHIHAIGDRAVREALDAIEAARTKNGPGDRRHCVAHIEIVHPDDVARFAELGVVANCQPLWACREPQLNELTLPFLGVERAEWLYPFESIRRAGARLCFGSDWPVSTPDVLAQLHVAVTRTPPPDPGAAPAPPSAPLPLVPHEALELEVALHAATMGSAYANHLDEETGSITVGKRADLVVLDRDLMALGRDELTEAAVDLTVVDGTVVFERHT